MPNSLNTRLLRVTNEEENGQVITQIRPREYNHNISHYSNYNLDYIFLYLHVVFTPLKFPHPKHAQIRIADHTHF